MARAREGALPVDPTTECAACWARRDRRRPREYRHSAQTFMLLMFCSQRCAARFYAWAAWNAQSEMAKRNKIATSRAVARRQHSPTGCRMCGARRPRGGAHEVDHIDGNPLNNQTNNLQSLCSPCHQRKTYAQRATFRRRRARQAVGPGHPTAVRRQLLPRR